MAQIRKALEIGSNNNSIFTTDFDNVSGKFDIEEIAGSLSFNLPYYLSVPSRQEGYELKESLKLLQKQDTVKVYYGYFEDSVSAVYQDVITYQVQEWDYSSKTYKTVTKTENTYNVTDSQGNVITLTKIFDGFIDGIKLSVTKTNINYEISCLGTLAVANYRTMEYQVKTSLAVEFIPTLLQLTGLQKGGSNLQDVPVKFDAIPNYKIKFTDVDTQNTIFVTEGGDSLKQILDTIKEKYSVIIHYTGEGYLNIMSPFFLVSKIDELVVWPFDINNNNIFEFDYGDLTNQFNAVIVVGSGVIGTAIDVTAVEANNGIISYTTLENRKCKSVEECQKVARNELLRLSKNQIVSFKTIFKPEFEVGQAFTIVDNDRFDGTQKFIIKQYSFTINKNDVSCTIQGWNNGLNFINQDLLLSDTGILDTDVLGISDKPKASFNWGDL